MVETDDDKPRGAAGPRRSSSRSSPCWSAAARPSPTRSSAPRATRSPTSRARPRRRPPPRPRSWGSRSRSPRAGEDGSTPGTVLDTRPPAGEQLDEGDTLTLIISLGNTPAPGAHRPGRQDARGGHPAPHRRGRLHARGHRAGVRGRPRRASSSRVGEGVPAELPKGDPVPLIVSSGPAPRTVPSGLVGGIVRRRPRRPLEGVQLKAKKVDEFSDDVEKGKVIRVEPGEGEQVARDSEVAVVVSKGPDVVKVPEVSGMSLDEAVAAIEGAGLVVGDAFGPANGDPFLTDAAGRHRGAAAAPRSTSTCAGSHYGAAPWGHSTAGSRSSRAPAGASGASTRASSRPRVPRSSSTTSATSPRRRPRRSGPAVARPSRRTTTSPAGPVARRWWAPPSTPSGSLDVLVNNAGILRDRMLVSMSEEEWDAVVDVHLKGHFVPTRFAAAHWREQVKAGRERCRRRSSTRPRPRGCSATRARPTTAPPRPASARSASSARRSWLATACGRTASPRPPAPGSPRRPRDWVTSSPRPTDGFDLWDPANVSPLVAYLATASCEVTGRTFFVQGGTVRRDGAVADGRARVERDARWTIAELGEALPDILG